MNRPSRRTMVRLVLFAGIPAFLLLVVGPWAYISLSTSDRRTSLAKVGDVGTAIVFGAGLSADGTPSPFLSQRLDLAVALVASGQVQHVLVTGDNSRVDYDEVGAMHRYLVAHGVPDSSITEDHAGFDTYDSCYRAHAIFGVRRAVLLTQTYHVPRAVFLCRHLGIDAVGVGGDEWSHHFGDTLVGQVRELASDLKALVEIDVTHPKPHFLGHAEHLN